MYKKFFWKTSLTVLTALFCFQSSAQIIHGRDGEEPGDGERTGPGSDYFQHTVIGFGFVIPHQESDSLSSLFGRSLCYQYGTRGIAKINRVLDVNWQLIYYRQRHSLRQDSLTNLLGFQQSFRRQHLDRHLLELSAALRFNYGMRGNTLGKFIDLGGFASWAMGTRLKMKSSEAPSALNGGSNEQVTVFRGLDYSRGFEYGLVARIGLNKLSFWGRYRLSDMFVESDHINGGRKLPELSRIAVGLQFAI